MKKITDYQFFKKLTKLPFVEEIWLFGSRSRGDNQERADIDLAIVCTKGDQDEWHQVLEIVEEADTLLKIDRVNFKQLSLNSEIRANILKDRIVLFRKEGLMPEKLEQQLGYLGNALLRLEEMINEPVDKMRAQIDSSAQRFECCFELFWKTLRLVLETRGHKVTFSKDVLRMAYQGGLIEDEAVWLKMLDDRNETSHIYNQEVADRIYSDIKNSYFTVLQATYVQLKEKVQTETDRISIKP